jgi:hypothetical protein
LFRKSDNLWEETDLHYKPLGDAKPLPELARELFSRYGIKTS